MFTTNVFLNLDIVILNLTVKLISFALKINVLIDVLLSDVLVDLNVLKDSVFLLHLNVDMHMIALQDKNAIIKAVVLISVMVCFVLQLIDVLMVSVLGFVKIQDVQMVLDVTMGNVSQFKGTVLPLHSAKTLRFAI